MKNINSDSQPRKGLIKRVVNKIDKPFLILFIVISIVIIGFSINDMLLSAGGIGSIGELYKQYGVAEINKELLTVINLDLLFIVLLLAALIRGFMAALVTIINWVASAFLGKCPKCKRLFACKRVKTNQTGTEDISVKVINEDKSSSGRVVKTSEQYIPGKRIFMEDIYRCKQCGCEFSNAYSSVRANV